MNPSKKIHDANIQYHNIEAGSYDTKWGISFEATGREQVVNKISKALGSNGKKPTFTKALEIGAGTGYFGLNALQANFVEELVCTDISQSMLDNLQQNAAQLNLNVEGVINDSEQLPFPDASFDLVFGHAILHHLPRLDNAFHEFWRVLKPGGTIFFAGEPSHYGDRIAEFPKQLAKKSSPLWRRMLGIKKSNPDQASSEHEKLQKLVDVHTFTPKELIALAKQAEFGNVRVQGEELLANLFGWFNRTLEWSADPSDIPKAWCQYAYHGYLTLQRCDQRILEPYLPPTVFYNLLLSGTKSVN